MCPGRHLAKHEILTLVAMLVIQFDVEVTSWTMLDGTPSQRAAEDDARYSGLGAMPLDRDARLRVERIAFVELV